MIVISRQPTEDLVTARYDREIRQAAATALAASKYLPLRRLSCTVSGGIVEISGTVSSFYLKQLAQAAVLHLHKVENVRNLVQVCGESPVLVATTCGDSASDLSTKTSPARA
jgi:osmotically-inducible protein OsmY